MSAAQQPAFDEATQVCISVLSLDHDEARPVTLFLTCVSSAHL